MGRTTTFKSDGKSPLTQYVRLLQGAAYWLPIFVERDSEAVRLLTTTSTLTVARARAERWYWDRRIAANNGKTPKFSRVWTRRDEKFVLVQFGPQAGFVPSRRTQRLIDRIGHLMDSRFRAALDEARSDGTMAVLGSKFDESKRAINAATDQARTAADGDGSSAELEILIHTINQMVVYFFDWMKPPKPEGPTWSELEREAKRQVELFGNDYRFTNAAVAAANRWCEILTHDESHPKYFGTKLAEFFEWFHLAAKLWNEGDNDLDAKGVPVTFGHRTGKSAGVTAMDAMRDFRELLIKGAMTDTKCWGDCVVNAEFVNAFRDSLIKHCEAEGISWKPADGLAFVSAVESHLLRDAQMGPPPPSRPTDEQELGRRLWDCISANHSVGTDPYELAKLLESDGRCEYLKAGEVLLPEVEDKSQRTNKFHAVVKRVNTTAKLQETNCHVCRDPENKNQVVVKSGYKQSSKTKSRRKGKR